METLTEVEEIFSIPTTIFLPPSSGIAIFVLDWQDKHI